MVLGVLAADGCARGNPAFDDLSAADAASADGGTSKGSADDGDASLEGGVTTSPTDSAGTDGGAMPTSSGMTDPTGASDVTVGGTDSGDPLCAAWEGECTLFVDNACPDGFKCAPVEVDGAWGAQCVPVDVSPGLAGQPCTRTCGVNEGADDCGRGTVCWLDRCVAMCDLQQPACSKGMDMCLRPVDNDPGFGLCVPECNPLLQNCGLGEACLPEANGGFSCFPAPGAGGQGTGCQFQNSCAPGFVCHEGAFVEECQEQFCCTSLCNLDNPMCPGAHTCLAFAQPSPLFPNVGACSL